jgi:hypothetical protein
VGWWRAMTPLGKVIYVGLWTVAVTLLLLWAVL